MRDCEIEPWADDWEEWYVLQHKIVKAAKEHSCEECTCPILPGEKYEIYKVKQEGDIYTAKTCLDCVSLRKGFFPYNWMAGSIRDDIIERIYELHGIVDSECIMPLTPLARIWVFDLIEEEWERTDEHEKQWEIEEGA